MSTAAGMATGPRFSVVVPAYQAAPTLGATLDAIMAQAFRDWECVVVDDGSTDDTLAIATAYAERDARFRVVHQSNPGTAGAYNARDRLPGQLSVLATPSRWLAGRAHPSSQSPNRSLMAGMSHRNSSLSGCCDDRLNSPNTWPSDTAEAGVVNSVGSKGDSYDNALAESVNSLYKAELIRRHRTWRTTGEVELATAVWVSWWNEGRLHSACGDVPPAEFEEAYHRQLEATVAA